MPWADSHVRGAWQFGDPGNLQSSDGPRCCYVAGTTQIDLLYVLSS
jgi:hypothetical protein